MPTYTTTTKHALRKLTGSNLVSDIDAGFTALADDIDAIMARADHGPESSRPTSTGGSPGKLGRSYYADDTARLFFDYGTGWITVYETEAWRNVGAGGQPAFTAGDFSSVSGGTVGFCRIDGVVLLRGSALASGGAVAGNPIFTLPTGYRPAQALELATMSSDIATSTFKVVRVQISTAGVVKQGSVGGSFAGVVGLDGVSFRGDQ